ncbi:MAG TPA: DNA-directed RNA polymerase subunit beta', partial [Kribbella sp.]
QAFEPQLVEGKAIQLHPLVCEAFNADFDGDQMAVHLPLSAEAQSEARVLMLSSNNILSPASGRPLAMPRLDMVTGLYHLTRIRPEAHGNGGSYSSLAEAIMAYDRKTLHLQAPIKIRLPGVAPIVGTVLEDGEVWKAETTLGRVLFNELLPVDYPFINDALPKKAQAAIINDLAERYSMTEVAQVLDRLKDAGFYWATRSGVTLAIDDVVVPPNKQQILDGYELKADQVNKRYQRGALSHQERNDEMVKIWTQASEEVARAMEDNFPEDNPIPLIVKSGAAGNMTQVRQLAGMRGLVANPKGEYIPRPIKANFREGLSVLEYFISTHGTRKGLADTALRTADSGYLTRRLVDVSQDVIVREVDCGTERAVTMAVTEETADGTLIPHRYIRTSVYARCSAEEVRGPDGEIIVEKGGDLGDPALDALVAAGVRTIRVRSALTCASATGICGMCYGRSMATGKLVDVGEAVGIVAAQSIGEPGTQLTMRTFHQGGVAGDDITTGLPRVTELFEARVPRGKAPIADVDGRIRIEDGDRFWKITLTPDDGGEEIVYEKLSKRQWLAMTDVDGQERPLRDGDHVHVGQLLLEGTADPHEVLRVMGPREVQLHLVREVQKVYRTQSVDIHDKHIEVIVRQMLRRVTIIDSGATEFLPGALAERGEFESENRRVVSEGNEPASGRPVLMGITKASLATESWLSAASFQETTRILTDAAINGKRDKLVGLKENVIIGKLIPAGTGINRYRNIQVQPTEEARAAAYALPSYDDGYYSPDVFGTGTGAAVPLDDYDFGRDYR